MGPGVVLDMRGRPRIDHQALESSSMGVNTRVLLKIDNGPWLKNISCLNPPQFPKVFCLLPGANQGCSILP